MAEPARIRVGFIGVGVMARVHLGDMLRRNDTDVVARVRAVAGRLCRGGRAVRPARLAGPAERARLATVHRDVRERPRRRRHHHAARVPFRPGEGRPRSGTGRPAREADGDDRRGSHRADRHARPDGPAARRAFQGSLSPQVREASRRLRSGELGPILNVNAVAWQDWATLTDGTWRQDPALSGGGFLFDTGAHMLNTVSDLAGEEFAQVAAWLENDGRPVDIRAVVMGRLASGRAGDHERLRERHPVVPLGHPRVHDARRSCGPGSGARSWRSSEPGRAAPQGPLGVADADLAAVPQRQVRADGQPEPAGSRPSDGPPLGCDPRIDGTRWRGHHDPDGVAPARRRCEPPGDPGHGLERVPPGAIRRTRRAPSTRTASMRAIADGPARGRSSRCARPRSTSPSTG